MSKGPTGCWFYIMDGQFIGSLYNCKLSVIFNVLRIDNGDPGAM